MTDWNKIKAEYVTSRITFPNLAKKYGISVSTLSKRASKEKWKEKRKESGKKEERKTIEKITTQKAKQQAKEILKIEDLSLELLRKVAEAIPEVNLYLVKNEDGEMMTEQGLIKTNNLKTLSDILINLDKLKKEDNDATQKLDEILEKIKGVI